MIEILIAFTIAALALSATLRLLPMGLAGAARAASYEQAVMLARSKLEALGGLILQAHGDASDDEGPFHWQVSMRRYGEPGTSYSNFYLVPYEVAVDIVWTEGGRQRSYTLRTIRLGPQ